MVVKALLLDGFGTVLDWRAPFRSVNEDALKRAHASVDGLARLPPYADWAARYHELRKRERETHDPLHQERDYVRRFLESFEGAGLGKRQARVVGLKAAERYFRELEASMRLAPDATPEFWRALPDGVRVVLVSNYGHGESMRRALERLGVLARFDATVITGDVGFLKPHPVVFERALEAAGVAPEEALMVGDDHVRDVVGAHAAGVRAALVANPRPGLKDAAERAAPEDPAPAVAVLSSLADLPALVPAL